mgnify:FL=1
MFTRQDTFARHAAKRRASLSEDERAAFAVTVHGRVPLVWIDPEKHRTVAEIANSAAHETVHIVLGADFPHGAAFERRVRRLIRGGGL